jgi:hypothetical protein
MLVNLFMWCFIGFFSLISILTIFYFLILIKILVYKLFLNFKDKIKRIKNV